MEGRTSAPSFTLYFAPMCGRVVQASDPLRYAFVEGCSESVTRLPSFRTAYAKRCCIIPVDCFF